MQNFLPHGLLLLLRKKTPRLNLDRDLMIIENGEK